MFNKSKLFFWTVEIFILTLLIYIWKTLGIIFTPLVSVINTIFLPVLIAGFLYYVTNPIVTFLEKRFKIKRIIGIFAVLFALILLFVLIVMSILPNMISQLTGLINSSQDVYNNLQTYVTKLSQTKPFSDILNQIDMSDLVKKFNLSYTDILTNVLNGVTFSVGSIVSLIVKTVLTLLLIPVWLFYMLKDADRILPFIKRTILPKDKLGILTLADELNRKISRYIRGLAIDVLYIFVFAFIGYLILGIHYALLFALFAGITNIIPYIGPYIGLIPVVLTYSFSDPKKAIIAIIYILIIQQIDGNIVYPRVIGGVMNVHPLTIMVLLLIGGNIYGIVGMIIIIPIYSIGKEILNFSVGIYRNRKKHKNMV